MLKQSVDLPSKKRPTVLLATDDVGLIPGLAEGYRASGFQVVTGVGNFFMRSCSFDLVHVLWPEELCQFRLPQQSKINEICEACDAWAQNSTLIVSVNNLYPHGYEGNSVFKTLYDCIYDRCSLIVHHCISSKNMVNAEFPSAMRKRHLVTTMFNYDHLLPPRINPELARQRFGFNSSDFVILVFGAIRHWEEVRLLKAAFRRVQSNTKRLLLGARYVEKINKWEFRYRQLKWRLWAKMNRTSPPVNYIPDEDVHWYFEAADVIVVPRICDLSSGIVGLGCTFGKTMVLPNHGAFPDYLANTENFFYQSGDAIGLAKAIDKAAAADRQRIGEKNRELANQWYWKDIVWKIVEALDLSAVPHA